MNGDVSPGEGPLGAWQLAREQPASGPGLPRERPHRTLAPGSSSLEARSHPPLPAPALPPAAPGSEGREVGPGGGAAPPAMSSRREGPRPLLDARPPGRPRRPSSSKRRAGAPRAPHPRPRLRAPSSAPLRAQGGRAEHLLGVGARGPRAPTPRSSPGPGWPNTCWAGRRASPQRVPFRPGVAACISLGLGLGSGPAATVLALPEPRGPTAARQRHLLPAPAKRGRPGCQPSSPQPVHIPPGVGGGEGWVSSGLEPRGSHPPLF